MRRYLLDTGIMGDLMSRRLGVLERVEEARRRGDRVGTCWPVAGELWYGLEGSATRERNLQRLIRTLNELTKWPCEAEAAQLLELLFELAIALDGQLKAGFWRLFQRRALL